MDLGDPYGNPAVQHQQQQQPAPMAQHQQYPQQQPPQIMHQQMGYQMQMPPGGFPIRMAQHGQMQPGQMQPGQMQPLRQMQHGQMQPMGQWQPGQMQPIRQMQPIPMPIQRQPQPIPVQPMGQMQPQLGQNAQPGPSNQMNQANEIVAQTQKARPVPYEWYFRCGLCRRDYGSDGKSRPCFLNGDHICESCADFEIQHRGNESRKLIYYAFVDVLSISKELKPLLNLLTGEVHREANPFECSVCMENYNAGENAPTVMTCGHAVCLNCYALIENCPRCGMVLVKNVNPGNEEDVPALEIQRPFNQANTGNQFLNQMEPMFGYGQNQGNQQNQGPMAANNQSQQDSLALVLTKHFRSFVTALLAALSRKRKRSQEDEEEDEHNSLLTDSQPLPTAEQNVSKVSCEECKRSVDLNDMFNCVTCSEKKICSRCMFRKHQKEKGHEVRELINDKINGMLKETQLFTDNQYETYLGIVPNLNLKIMEEFGKLPNLLTAAYYSIGSDSHSNFDVAKEKLNDCRRIGKRLEKISEDYVPQARKYIKRLAELVEYAQMKYPSPVDPLPKIKTEAITPPHEHISQSNSSPSNHHHNEMFSEENPFPFSIN